MSTCISELKSNVLLHTHAHTLAHIHTIYIYVLMLALFRLSGISCLALSKQMLFFVSFLTGRLVSFNKPTYIESTLDYRGTWNSFYAVDGRHPKLGEDQDNKTIRTCAATDVSNPARNKWWKVDLNNTYSIIAVSFYGRYSNPGKCPHEIYK